MWIQDKRYKYLVADTKEKLELADKYLMDGDKPRVQIRAYDTETNGLHIKRNVIIGFSFSNDSVSGIYVPLLKWVPDTSFQKTRTIDKVKYEVFPNGKFIDVWNVLATYPEDVTPQQYQPPKFILDYVKRWTKDVQLLMHNAPFDCNMTRSNWDIQLRHNLLCDTLLLKHFIDENTSMGLKDAAELWSDLIGFSAKEEAKKEQAEMGKSVIENGGEFTGRNKHIWRADLEVLGKYGMADTALTFGLFEAGIQQLESQYEPEHFELFFQEEIMPTCREVIIPMIYNGVYIDVPHFEKMKKETKKVLDEYENEIIRLITPHLDGFTLGKSIEEAVSTQAFVKYLIDYEGLDMPMKLDKKTGKSKPTIAKTEVKKCYQQEPHFVWGYIMGEEELPYPQAEIDKMKLDIYETREGRRHRFNVRSRDHLRWLLFDKLGHDKKSVPQTKSATVKNPIPSVAADVLKEHFGQYDFVPVMMKYFKLYKLYSSYIIPACELHHNGWLHMNIKQAGTKSGRLAISGGFNLQTLPQVEELENCSKCKSKNVTDTYRVELLAEVTCGDCGHVDSEILCPSAIKKGFIAPPGYKIVNADYSSLEPRCFAFMSNEQPIKDIYFKNLDFYSQIYAQMERLEYVDLKKAGMKKERNMIKPVALGIPYGAGDGQVANLMGLKTTRMDKKTGEWVEVLDIEAGAEKRRRYLDAFPKLEDYMLTCEIEAIEQGFVETIVGRRRHFQWTPWIVQNILRPKGIAYDEFVLWSTRRLNKVDIPELDLWETELVEFSKFRGLSIKQLKEKGNWNWAYVKGLIKNELNNAKNHKIQGLGAHITNAGMLDTTRFYRQNNVDGYVCLQVHDEITCYVKEDQLEEGVKWLQIGMEKNKAALKVDIPMIAEPLIATTLKEAK